MILTVIIFLVILSLLVLIHEAGHFIMARIFGIKVEEFGFGLPPRALVLFKRGDTVYTLNWLPIGGFVKLYGEDEAGSGSVSVKEQKVSKKDVGRAFFARPAWQRAVVIVAGVFMNFALAVIIISVLFSAVGVPMAGDKVEVSALVKGAPAQSAGLKVGDTIESINGQKITTPAQLVSYTKERLGQKLTLKVVTKDNKTETLQVTPRKVYPSNEGPMGIAISPNVITKKYPWYQAPFSGTWEALKESYMILSGLVVLVSQLLFHASVPTDIAGPVGIAQLTGQVVQIGPVAVLSFISLLSLNLAILNILPIPALDGGRLFFILIEAIFRKKVDQRIEGYAHAIGMALLLALILLITIHDLFRLFTGQPLIPQLK